MSTSIALWSLFSSSFLSATLLPGTSEIVLTAMLAAKSASVTSLILVATFGNVLGGLTNVIIGRLLPQPKSQKGLATAMRWLQRYGAPALLLSWLPMIGDLLCVAAGWLRLPLLPVTIYLLIGKALRYMVLALIIQGGISWWS